MSFLQNSRLISPAMTMRKFLLALIIVITAGNFLPAYSSDETIRILERWTSSHWGQDCFVWVVHYPEELIGPWVEAEAQRSGMSDSERERFRSAFVSELSLETSETFLVSVYSFGARPVNLSPVKDNISLLAASGERVKPTRYDNSLDNPSIGVVQGLVFFPKQNSKDYVIGIRGMGSEERIFSFAPPEQAPAKPANPDVVVVELPRRQPRKPPVLPARKPPAPTPPPPPPVPPKPITPIFQEDSRDMAAFVRSVQDRGNPPQSASVRPPAPTPTPTPRPSNIDSAYVSRESVLRKFLSLWADNKPNEMYDMLSDVSKKQISRENFARAVSRDSAMRQGLKSDYRIDWIGEERAKVITTRKTLVFRSVVTRTFGVTREGSSWRVVW